MPIYKNLCTEFYPGYNFSTQFSIFKMLRKVYILVQPNMKYNRLAQLHLVAFSITDMSK